MDTTRAPRVLTHDEQKAAEAAFAHRPLNPAWSESAKKVYEGLIRALPTLPDESGFSVEESAPPPVPTQDQAVEPQPKATEPTERSVNQLITHQQAIDSGFLIDVTADAKKLGLSFSVMVTKPLWEVGIAPSHELSEEEKAARLRDVLMAFRLRIATQGTLSPLIDFPAMLALPPGEVPQPIPLFALIQPDKQDQATVTLLLPNEVSATIIPMN